MRRIQRAALPKVAQSYLSKRQLAANGKHKSGDLNIERDWKSARQTKPLKAVVTTLQTMMGPRQRCMYCLDSHGADIEHFRPKAVYPKRMYEWPNLLLCCTECGRFKGNKFPMSGKQAMLIDPTREDPWKHLDFDPVTGNISARFDLQLNDWSAKGAAISKFETSYVSRLPAAERRIEQFCNKIAAEILIPSDDFGQQIAGFPRNAESVQDHLYATLASRYGVSREAILRRLLDMERVSQSFYEQKAKLWSSQKKAASGGDWYASQNTYLSDRLAREVIGRHYRNQISVEQASEFLGIKAKNFAGLEQRILQGAAA